MTKDVNKLMNEPYLLQFLKDIEDGVISIEWTNPEYGCWMGNLKYTASNGYQIIVFSDVFCFDYIESIKDDGGKLLYDYLRDHERMPNISEYNLPDEVIENIYHIKD